MHYKIPLLLEPQDEGGFTVTSPAIPELITEGDSATEALKHVSDALDAVRELYLDMGKEFPSELQITSVNSPMHLEAMVEA